MLLRSSLLFALVGLLITSADAQYTARMTDRVDLDYDLFIVQDFVAPPFWDLAVREDNGRRTRYRALVLRSEYQPSLVIEIVNFGTEGCCARLVAARDVDLAGIAQSLGVDEGEPFTFAILGALAPRRFRARMNDQTIILDIVNAHAVRVTRDTPQPPGDR